MQRWILLGVALVVLVLAGVGGVLGYKEYLARKPDRIFLPLQLRPGLTTKEKAESVEKLREMLLTEKVLVGIVMECGVVEEWKLSSVKEGVEELKRRAILEVGTTDLPTGRSETLNVGFRGIAREHDLLKKLTNALGEDLKRLTAAPDAEME